jgi:nucleoside phosphorylase
MSLLICAAFSPEIQFLHDPAGKDYMTATLGVGLVSAASSIAAVLERHSISRIVFTGTCGALPSTSLTIGDVVRAKTIYLGDIGTLNRTSFIPDIIPTTVTPARFIAMKNTLPESDVFCPLSITQSDTGASLLQKNFPNGVVENLECFAVAWNAAQRKIPFEAVLGVSNFIGPNGHDEWKQHHHRVSHVTQTHIQSLLRS